MRPAILRLSQLCLAALPLLTGCATEGTGFKKFVPTYLVRAAAADEAEKILPPTKEAAANDGPAAPSEAVPEIHLLPITLDTVLRLAEDQNGQIALARARVAEADAEVDLAGKRWLPDLYLG